MSFAKLCASAVMFVVLPLAAQADSHPRQGMGMAQGGPMMGHAMPRQGMGAPRPFAGVQFTEEQRKQIQAMMESERKTHEQRVEKMLGLQKQLRELYMAEKWDAQAITRLYENIHAEQRKTIAAMAEARNKVYDLLTKEQREQMKQRQQRFAPQQAPQ